MSTQVRFSILNSVTYNVFENVTPMKLKISSFQLAEKHLVRDATRQSEDLHLEKVTIFSSFFFFLEKNAP